MLLQIGRAVLRGLGTLAIVAILNFLLFRVAPGDPASLLLSGSRSGISEAEIEAKRARWGLDQPVIPNQLISYVASTIRGDLGYSYKYRGDRVSDLLVQRLPATIVLVGLAQLTAIGIGLAIGVLVGWRRGRAEDALLTNSSLVLYATPSFWLGMVLVLAFSVGLGWFPAQGSFTPGATYPGRWAWLGDGAIHLVLPVTALSLVLVGQYVLVTRAAVSNVLTEDYMVTARAKGLTSRQMLIHHALRNAMLPVVTLVTLNLGYIVTGAVTLEAVFAWPGIGQLTVEALNARDYPVLQGIFLLLGTAIVLANLLADLLYAILDPRVRT